jgi:hypothetical protein
MGLYRKVYRGKRKDSAITIINVQGDAAKIYVDTRHPAKKSGEDLLRRLSRWFIWLLGSN